MKAAIIGASIESLHTIEVAHKLGLTVAAFDGNPNAEGLKAADEFYVVDISDEKSTIEAVRNANIDFVLTVPIGRYLTTIGAVNEALQLPGITRQMAEFCTDKYAFHMRLQMSGLRKCTCYCLPEELEGDMSLRFPAILKPRFGSGSRGIYYLESKKELKDALKAIGDEPYILEECAEGDEYGMDGAVVAGKFYMVLLRKKDNTPLPNRQAVAYYSVNEEDEFYRQVTGYMQKVIDALGLSECLLHADLIRTESGPFAIEVSARPSGHNLHNLFTPMATGVDMAEQYIRYRMGEKYSFVPSKTEEFSIHFFDMEGMVTHIPSSDELMQTDAEIAEWNCHISEGEVLTSVSDGHSVMGRGYFVLKHNKKEEPAMQALRIKDLFGVR